ncbi:MAG: hypothetical protein PXY39_04645 [archaeon]|nr:hypothetical protein [archaeon]
MQRRQLLGIVIFGIGGSLLTGSGLFAEFVFNYLFVPGPNGLGPSFFSPEGLLIDVAFGFVPYFLIGLGLYLIFKPLLTMGALFSGPETSKVSLAEKESRVESERIKQLSDEELQKELVSMKTIEHVLVPRLGTLQNQNSSESREMTQMLKKARERITAIEAELRERRQRQEQNRLTAVQN